MTLDGASRSILEMVPIDIRIQAQVVDDILIVDLHAKQGVKLAGTSWRSVAPVNGLPEWKKVILETVQPAVSELIDKLK